MARDSRAGDDVPRWNLRVEGPVRSPDLVAVLEERDGGPDEFTLYPADAAEERRTTAWITAAAGSVLSLREWQ